MKSLLVSACLLGAECKYSGGSNRLSEQYLAALRTQYRIIPVCPEVAGGLPVPREPSERRDGGVYSRTGTDVTAEYEKGAHTAVQLAERFGCTAALLKEQSPSCGSGRIYDGSFSGVLISGYGTAAEALKERGIDVFGESRVKDILDIG